MTQDIMNIVISVLAILIPFGVKYMVNHIGKDKVNEALKIAILARDFIIGYYKVNPSVKIKVEDIMDMFKERVLKVLPLTDAELDYLWEQIKFDIIEALKIEVDYTTKLNMTSNIKDTNKKQKLLFK